MKENEKLKSVSSDLEETKHKLEQLTAEKGQVVKEKDALTSKCNKPETQKGELHKSVTNLSRLIDGLVQ